MTHVEQLTHEDARYLLGAVRRTIRDRQARWEGVDWTGQTADMKAHLLCRALERLESRLAKYPQESVKRSISYAVRSATARLAQTVCGDEYTYVFPTYDGAFRADAEPMQFVDMTELESIAGPEDGEHRASALEAFASALAHRIADEGYELESIGLAEYRERDRTRSQIHRRRAQFKEYCEAHIGELVIDLADALAQSWADIRRLRDDLADIKEAKPEPPAPTDAVDFAFMPSGSSATCWPSGRVTVRPQTDRQPACRRGLPVS